MNANLNINGGEGNDTITTNLAGDWKVVGGAGNDVVYDNVNSAANASWTLNGAGSNIVSGNNDKNFFSGVDVSVTFKHITKTVKVSSTDGFTTDLQINQAIKDAINNDATLKNWLGATDGPANSLVVSSLVDGAVQADLNVAFARTTTLSATEAATIGAAYKAAYLSLGIDPAAILPTLVSTVAEVTAVMDKHILTLTQTSPATATEATNDTTNDQDYSATAGSTTFVGETASTGNQGDSTFTLGTGDDILVLDTNADSGDKVVYSAGEQFGNDTIVNFAVATRAAGAALDAKVDKLDFSALGGDMNAANAVNYVPASANGDVAINFVNLATAQTLVDAGVGYSAGVFATQTTGANVAGTAGYFATPTAGTNQDAASTPGIGAAQANKSIVIMDLDELLNTNSVNDTAAEVASFFEDLVATTHIAIVVDKHNVGSVYAVTDGTGAADATATLMGTIDLGSTQWSTLTADNFV